MTLQYNEELSGAAICKRDLNRNLSNQPKGALARSFAWKDEIYWYYTRGNVSKERRVL